MARGIAHRDWALHRSDYETDADFRAAIENEMALNVQIMERLGVAIVSAPVRRRVGQSWFTEGVIFKTASVPAAPDADTPPAPTRAVAPPAVEATRPMVGPGGEEEDVPQSLWPARLDADWEFDDEDDDWSDEIPDSLLQRAE